MKNFISEIINEWDPISLFPLAPNDEYATEVTKIMELVSANTLITCKELALKIDNIFSITFGADVYASDILKCEEIAKKITDYINKVMY